MESIRNLKPGELRIKINQEIDNTSQNLERNAEHLHHRIKRTLSKASSPHFVAVKMRGLEAELKTPTGTVSVHQEKPVKALPFPTNEPSLPGKVPELPHGRKMDEPSTNGHRPRLNLREEIAMLILNNAYRRPLMEKTGLTLKKLMDAALEGPAPKIRYKIQTAIKELRQQAPRDIDAEIEALMESRHHDEIKVRELDEEKEAEDKQNVVDRKELPAFQKKLVEQVQNGLSELPALKTKRIKRRSPDNENMLELKLMLTTEAERDGQDEESLDEQFADQENILAQESISSRERYVQRLSSRKKAPSWKQRRDNNRDEQRTRGRNGSDLLINEKRATFGRVNLSGFSEASNGTPKHILHTELRTVASAGKEDYYHSMRDDLAKLKL